MPKPGEADAEGRGSRGATTVWIVAAALPALLFLLVYARSLPYEFVWTDQAEIEQGLVIRPPGRVLAAFGQPMYEDMARLSPGSVQPYYRPLKVVVASWIDHGFGRRPAAFRSVNLVLGAATFALFALLAGLIFRDPLSAGFVASIAAVHPAGIENYVWPSGLDDALAKLFVVASILTTVWAAARSGVATRAGLGVLAFALLALGLCSKESAVVTPALAALCLWGSLASQDTAAGRQEGGRYAPLLWLIGSQIALVGFYLLLWRPLLLGGFGAGVPPIGGSYAVHLLTVLATWPDRIAWLFLPLESTSSDVVSIVTNVLAPSVIVALLLALSAPWVGWRLWRTGNRMAALGWAWMWIAFLPTSGLLPLSHVRAERQLALSALGTAFLLASLVRPISSFLPQTMRRTAVLVLSVALIGVLAQRTAVRISDWRSDIALFSHDVERDPLYREGRFVLAVALAEAGRDGEARQQLHQLAAVNESFAGHASFLRQDRAAQLLCEVDLRLGLSGETLEIFGNQLDARSPALASAPGLFACGAHSLERSGRAAEALAIYLALRERSAVGDDPRILLGLARSYDSLGNHEAAREWLAKTPRTLVGDPDYTRSRSELEQRLRRR